MTKKRDFLWFVRTLGICISRAVRFAFHPDFRVCFYRQVDGREITQSGMFPATGITQDECYDDAKAHLQRNHSGSFEFWCRLPFPWEAWGRFWDLLCGYSDYPLRGEKPEPEASSDPLGFILSRGWKPAQAIDDVQLYDHPFLGPGSPELATLEEAVQITNAAYGTRHSVDSGVGATQWYMQ